MLLHTQQQQQAGGAAAAAVAAGETTTEALANLARAESDAREAAALRGMCANNTDLVRAEGVRLTPAVQVIASRVTARLAYRRTLALVSKAGVLKLLVYEGLSY